MVHEQTVYDFETREHVRVIVRTEKDRFNIDNIFDFFEEKEVTEALNLKDKKTAKRIINEMAYKFDVSENLCGLVMEKYVSGEILDKMFAELENDGMG